MRIAVTADLHWGHNRGDEATRELAAHLWKDPPDVLVLAGDIGVSDHFAGCLHLFAGLPARKCLVPGNHDIWVAEDDARGSSLDVYRNLLPDLAAQHGFVYLDEEPLILSSSLAIAGTMNWYDYSWSLDKVKQEFPDWESRLAHKLFTRGRHNDARFVRWPTNDVDFTAEIVTRFERHLVEALHQSEQVIAITHHPAFYGLNFPRPGPPSPDGLLWDAFCGNTKIEAVLERYARKIPFLFCGHTHKERTNQLGPIRGFNVGSDYPFKRLLLLDWPAGTIEPVEFRKS
jgi:predicted phosphohydrolase